MFVYVIGAEVGPYKIGVARNVEKRLEAIRTGAADTVWILHREPIPPEISAYKVERSCHARLSHLRLNGEWFNVDFDSAVETIEAVKAETLLHASGATYDPTPTEAKIKLKTGVLAALEARSRQVGASLGDVLETLVLESSWYSRGADGGAKATPLDAESIRIAIRACGGSAAVSVLRRKRGVGIMSRARFNAALAHLESTGDIVRHGRARRTCALVAKHAAT